MLPRLGQAPRTARASLHSPRRPGGRLSHSLYREGPARCPLRFRVALFLAHFSNKSKRPAYWSLGTKHGAAIIHLCCAFLSGKHFPFPQLRKALFLN